MQNIEMSLNTLTKAKWKTRGRGSGVRGPGVWKTRDLVENTGSQWKTRGLSAKHGGTIFSPNNQVEILLFQIAMKFNQRETCFLRAEASEHISNFCEQFEQRPHFASTFKLNGIIRCP